MKCFLSHSSKDKEQYVNAVAEYLIKEIGEKFVVYDQYSFESGVPVIEEILDGIKESALFIVFLSNHSVSSSWVQDELKEAKKNQLELLGLRIYPILIDPDLSHESSLIPDWMRDESYNLKYVRKPIKAAKSILQRRNQMLDGKFPTRKHERACIGRNDLVERFETRVYENSGPPQCAIFSGMDEIGRRTLLKECLIKSQQIRENYIFPTIELDSTESIENFIVKLDDLSMANSYELGNLMTMDIDEKITIAASMINDIQNLTETLRIIDDECIISAGNSGNFEEDKNSNISDWFMYILDEVDIAKHISIVVVANRKLSLIARLREEYQIYSMEVLELNNLDKQKLLMHLANSHDLQLSRIGEDSDLNFFLSYLSGYPGQIRYAVKLMCDYGVKKVRQEYLDDISEYNSKKVQKALLPHISSEEKMAVLCLLSETTFATYEFLFDVLGRTSALFLAIEELKELSICEDMGRDNEAISINSGVRDFILRNRSRRDRSSHGVSENTYVLREDYQRKLEEIISTRLDKISSEEADLTDILYLPQKALKDNLPITKELQRSLLPSHYIQTIQEFSSSFKRNDEMVVHLSDRALQHEYSIDTRIVHKIRYYLCSSLARLGREERFYREIKFIKGIDHLFLHGFYNRKQGKPENAIPYFEEILRKGDTYLVSKAARELVEVYRDLERYQDALRLAKENYESRRGRTNAYLIQAYLNCLMNLE